MMMPGRKYDAGNGYRYGFNGKENDNEVKGEGNQQDYGMRIYDTRLGRFLSVDPLAKTFPWNSTYAYAENDVIRSIDLDGLEIFIVINNHDKYGRITRIRVESIESIENGEPINQYFKIRGTKKDLTSNLIYIQNLRQNQFITKDESRNGNLYPNELLAYNTAIISNNRSSAFDKRNDIPEGEPEALGNDFTMADGRTAFSYLPGSQEGITHNYKEGQRNFPKVTPLIGNREIGGSSFIRQSISNSANTVTNGNNGGSIDINGAVKYFSDEIQRLGREFKSNNNLNVGFVESITITYSGSEVSNQWKQVAELLQAKFGVQPNLVYDPNVEVRLQGASLPGSRGYAAGSASYSGVRDGNTQKASKVGLIK